jgi:hypothetical protein
VRPHGARDKWGMTQVAVAVDNPFTQLAGQCRDQPVVFDGVRPEPRAASRASSLKHALTAAVTE